MHGVNGNVKSLIQVKDRISKYDAFLRNNMKELNAKGMGKP